MSVLITLVLGMSLLMGQKQPESSPAGIILLNSGSEDPLPIVVSIGTTKGVYKGAFFDVERDGQHVARLRVKRVFPTDSECEVVEKTNLGIRPQDTARLIVEGVTQEQVEKTIQATGRTRLFEERGYYARGYIYKNDQFANGPMRWVIVVWYLPDKSGTLRAVYWLRRWSSEDDVFEQLPARLPPIQEVAKVGDKWE
jgi:hypothetical protein